MDEGFRSVMDELKRPVWGEPVRVVNDRIRTAAIFLEKLEAENECLKARCEAAEKDILHDCYTCAHLIKNKPRQCTLGCVLKPFAVEYPERCKWQWRGLQQLLKQGGET